MSLLERIEDAMEHAIMSQCTHDCIVANKCCGKKACSKCGRLTCSCELDENCVCDDCRCEEDE